MRTGTRWYTCVNDIYIFFRRPTEKHHVIWHVRRAWSCNEKGLGRCTRRRVDISSMTPRVGSQLEGRKLGDFCAGLLAKSFRKSSLTFSFLIFLIFLFMGLFSSIKENPAAAFNFRPKTEEPPATSNHLLRYHGGDAERREPWGSSLNVLLPKLIQGKRIRIRTVMFIVFFLWLYLTGNFIRWTFSHPKEWVNSHRPGGIAWNGWLWLIKMSTAPWRGSVHALLTVQWRCLPLLRLTRLLSPKSLFEMTLPNIDCKNIPKHIKTIKHHANFFEAYKFVCYPSCCCFGLRATTASRKRPLRFTTWRTTSTRSPVAWHHRKSLGFRGRKKQREAGHIFKLSNILSTSSSLIYFSRRKMSGKCKCCNVGWMILDDEVEQEGNCQHIQLPHNSYWTTQPTWSVPWMQWLWDFRAFRLRVQQMWTIFTSDLGFLWFSATYMVWSRKNECPSPASFDHRSRGHQCNGPHLGQSQGLPGVQWLPENRKAWQRCCRGRKLKEPREGAGRSFPETFSTHFEEDTRNMGCFDSWCSGVDQPPGTNSLISHTSKQLFWYIRSHIRSCISCGLWSWRMCPSRAYDPQSEAWQALECLASSWTKSSNYSSPYEYHI